MAQTILANLRAARPMTPTDHRRSTATPLVPFPRLYRCHIAAGRDGIERTAFVEASCHHGAIRKVANAVAALEMRLPDDVQERIYNCWSAAELIDDGISDDVELRLFETGCNGERALSFVENPLFLVAGSVPLIRKWASIQTEVDHAHS